MPFKGHCSRSPRTALWKHETRPSIIQTNVALAGMTTLQVGGHAEFFADIYDEAALVAAIRWARANDCPVTTMGAVTWLWPMTASQG